jgi:hypothetical protein
MVSACSTGLPAHTYPNAWPSKHAHSQTSKGDFSATAYSQPPAVAYPLWHPSAQASSLYASIARSYPDLLPSHTPTT